MRFALPSYALFALSLLALIAAFWFALGDIRPYENPRYVNADGSIVRSAFSEIDDLKEVDTEMATFERERVLGQIEQVIKYHIAIKGLHIRMNDMMLLAWGFLAGAYGLLWLRTKWQLPPKPLPSE